MLLIYELNTAMAITTAAKKALRKNIKSRTINAKTKIDIKDLAREIQELVSSGKTEEAKKLMSSFFAKIDKAAKKNIFAKNAAARKKSRISKLFKKA